MAETRKKEDGVRLSRYFIVLTALWIVAMTWRIYPQFGDALRVDGRLIGFADYVEESCGQRIGPAAASCLAEARITGRRLVASQQGKSVLLIEAPLLGYLLIYLPLGWAIRRRQPAVGSPRRAAQ
ncbi:MAG TPA: hypothetical protein VEI03_01640 [Stellaceae bacterium]|nr:hypothetical protein [Stellaceae bacterium]